MVGMRSLREENDADAMSQTGLAYRELDRALPAQSSIRERPTVPDLATNRACRQPARARQRPWLLTSVSVTAIADLRHVDPEDPRKDA
jgi:hypothetical protein